MKRLRNTLIGLIVTIVLIMTIVPMGVGLFFARNFYPLMLKHIAEREHIAISLLHYDWGWFSSHATVAVTLNKKDEPITIHQTIHTGPLLRVPGKGFRLAFAWIGTEHKGKKFPFTASTLVGSSVRTQLLTSHVDTALNGQLIQAHKLSYHRIDREHEHQQTIKADSFDLQNQATDENSSMRSINASGLIYTSLNQKNKGNQLSESSLQAKHLYLNAPHVGIWEADDLIAMVKQSTHGDTTSMSYRLHAKKLQSTNFSPREVSLSLSFNDINQPALNNLLTQLPHFGNKRTPKQFLALYLMMGELLKHGANVQLNELSLSSPLGPIQFNGSLAFPPGKTTNPAGDAVKHVSLRLHASMPQKIFLGLLARYLVGKETQAAVLSKHSHKPRVLNAHINTLIAKQAQKSAYAQTIQWAKEHAITLNNKRVSFTVLLQKEQWFFEDTNHIRQALKWLPLPTIKTTLPTKVKKPHPHQKKKAHRKAQ